jgi:ribosome-associated protein
MSNSRDFARAVASWADEKKAEKIVIMDLRGLSDITDFFVLCNGLSIPQLKAIASHIKQSAKEAGRLPIGREGDFGGSWVVLDFGDVVAHIFKPDAREFYSLEDYWNDAPREFVGGAE